MRLSAKWLTAAFETFPMNNKELFSHKSDDYSKFRPSYPAAAVDWLRQNVAGERVLDIGAGTGIFTKVLLHRFQNVCAVEPNAGMREKFFLNLPESPCSDGSGEETEMPDHSVDLITVAQAFHWLDEDRFKREAQRILSPGGTVAIIWNTSLNNEFTSARDEVSRKYCPRFRNGHAGKRSVAEGDLFLQNEYFREVKAVSFPNPFEMDLSVFEGNMRSRSYTPAADQPEYADFMKELRRVFEQYAENNVVVEPIETTVYLGRF